MVPMMSLRLGTEGPKCLGLEMGHGEVEKSLALFPKLLPWVERSMVPRPVAALLT